MRWDPVAYGRFADERSRPFFDLLSRVAVESPRVVVDLGCGPGDLTVTLASRWPGAEVRGIDSSPEMIAAAPPGAAFSVGTVEDFDATGVDVLIANAVLQWVPSHRELLERWARQVRGALAFQVPANFGAPSHVLLRSLAASWRLDGLLRGEDAVDPPAAYLDRLARAGLSVEAWQTEYLHVLEGSDPVLEWVRGTALRPVLSALSPQDADAFCAEYAALLREAYPPRPYGTVFPFRRTFVVASRAPGG